MQGKTASQPDVLLIDGLGTLVALEAPAPALRRELERRFGVEVSEAQAQRALAAEIAFYRARMGDGRDADTLRALRRRCAEVLRDALPAGDRLASVDTDSLTDALLASLRFRAFGDAAEALLAARARGQRVIVVSNWDVSLLEVLELVGLAPLLHAVVTSAAVRARKPSPAIFEHALALAGTPPGRAVHVGDSLEEDVEGARACGIAAVLLRRDGRPGPAGVVTVASLAQLTWS
jgi:putative hydrolase of the HAD superfamily